MVLILGRHNDPHTIAVTNAIEVLGQTVVCFDSFRGDPMCISLSAKPGFGSSIVFGENHFSDIKAVWMRQKPFIPMPWWGPLDHDAARFSQSEWRSAFQSLETIGEDVKWVNKPSAQRLISYKPRQLQIALQSGFTIPDTVVTNDPNLVKSFVLESGKVVYKSLSGYVFSDQTGILTSVVDLAFVESNSKSIARSTGIYQKFIEKDYEARVTVVGSTCFVAKIKTPKQGPGSIDWRFAQFDGIFEEGDIPDHIRVAIGKFQESAAIVYGAYDFVVSKNGDWIFLECNPVGQYLWLENELGFKISETIAKVLCSRQ